MCNATRCIIYLVKVCNIRNVCDYTHSNFKQRCVVCDLYNVQCKTCVNYAERVIVIHSIFLHKPSVALHAVCKFSLSVRCCTWCVVLHSVWPNKPKFTLFWHKIRFILIYALLRVKIWLKKSV